MHLVDELDLWYRQNGLGMVRELGIAPGQRVLDFGCGPGRYTVPLAQALAPDGLVLALDTDAEALRTLEQRVMQLCPAGCVQTAQVASDSGLAGIGDHSLDAALIFDVLQHVGNWDLLLDELARTLQPAGALHVYPASVPHPGAVDFTDLRSRLEQRGFALQTSRSFRMAHSQHMVDDTVHSFARS